ncbi:putative mitochondrial cytochrome b2 [Microthyrium microscopicum]|uniref:L-lactate dehydrogenase (cytochrome) n=1 Tax=Microthyrium microscopicum TaxID=703497 RepID=A0A6A6UIT7_9PEZI|nr:putative mitochondrial cytochrome b2 [Microthyrium microscopicum]
MAKEITLQEVSSHSSADSCWIVLYGKVYDVTAFAPSHPGGPEAILRVAGTDATEEYDPIHPPGTLEEHLPEECLLGKFRESPVKTEDSAQHQVAKNESKVLYSQEPYKIPSNLEQCLNLNDIEYLATSKISKRAWSYYYGAGDDLISKAYNNLVYQKILFRPRVFVDIVKCSLDTTLLQGQLKLRLPFYVSPAAQARLVHPSGEGGMAQACHKAGALQIISNNASLTPEQIVEASPETEFGFQLYVQEDRARSVELLARIKKLPQIKFICLTLDAAVPGKREHDERRYLEGAPQKKIEKAKPYDPQAATDDKSGGVAKALFAGIAMDLTWMTTLPWLEEHSDLPLVLKGIQTHEDALMASQHPQIKAIILSNHGGRSLDTAPPAIHTLLEIRHHCPQVFDRLEIWVDGGIKRGTDVVKALCLGAKAVGLGRSPLWGLGAGGPEGVEKVLSILRREMKTTLRLLGVEKVEQLGRHHVNSRVVEQEIYLEPSRLGGSKL